MLKAPTLPGGPPSGVSRLPPSTENSRFPVIIDNIVPTIRAPQAFLILSGHPSGPSSYPDGGSSGSHLSPHFWATFSCTSSSSCCLLTCCWWTSSGSLPLVPPSPSMCSTSGCSPLFARRSGRWVQNQGSPEMRDGPFFWTMALTSVSSSQTFFLGAMTMRQRLKVYIKDVWNKCDITAITLFIIGLICRWQHICNFWFRWNWFLNLHLERFFFIFNSSVACKQFYIKWDFIEHFKEFILSPVTITPSLFRKSCFKFSHVTVCPHGGANTTIVYLF